MHLVLTLCRCSVFNHDSNQLMSLIVPGKNLLDDPITFEKSEYTISLPNSYLVNCLCFEAYPDSPNMQLQRPFSYRIHVSQDKERWSCFPTTPSVVEEDKYSLSRNFLSG